METNSNNFEVQKSKANKMTSVALTSCCTPVNKASVCCEPSVTSAGNNGACCAQPEDGSVCCVK